LKNFNTYFFAFTEKVTNKLTNYFNTKKEIFDFINGIQNGFVSGHSNKGLSIKKLRNTNQILFEARLNSGDRILFTLKKPIVQ